MEGGIRKNFKTKMKRFLTPQMNLSSSFEAKKTSFKAYMQSGSNSCKKSVPVQNFSLLLQQRLANQERINRLVLGTPANCRERRQKKDLGRKTANGRRFHKHLQMRDSGESIASNLEM